MSTVLEQQKCFIIEKKRVGHYKFTIDIRRLQYILKHSKKKKNTTFILKLLQLQNPVTEIVLQLIYVRMFYYELNLKIRENHINIETITVEKSLSKQRKNFVLQIRIRDFSFFQFPEPII